MKKPFFIFLLLAALMSMGGAVLAQEALTETFTSEDGSFTVNHPDGWVTEVVQGVIYFGTNQATLDTSSDVIPKDQIRIGFAPPAILAAIGISPDSDTKTAAEQIMNSFKTDDMVPTAPISFKVGGLPATRVFAAGASADTMVIIVQHEAGFLLAAVQTGPGEMDSKLPFILEMLGTVTVSDAGTTATTTTTTTTSGDGEVIRQWANFAAASSQYGETSWSAQQATGEPNTPECGDYGTAWASATSTGQDRLVLGFEEIVVPTQINIHQTYNPGSITKVEVIGADESITELLKSVDPVGNTDCPGVFTINVAQDVPPVIGITIYFDQSIGGSWNEIDAVELVGTRFEGELPTPQPTVVPQTTGAAEGVAVTCPNGLSFTNGVEVIVNMRSGFTYTATAVGIDGFDPVIAVMDENGGILCNDDDSAAASYSADLPTTGEVTASNLSAQMPFNHSYDGFADISIIVGSPNSGAGEFLLLLEGLVVTQADGSGEAAGDPFTVNFSANVLAAETPVTVYMISVTSALDPLIKVMTRDNTIFAFDNGDLWACDDAGLENLCWGESSDLSRSYVSRTRGRNLAGGPLDAMMTVPPELFGSNEIFITWRFTSSGQASFGDYIAAFHMGTTASGEDA